MVGERVTYGRYVALGDSTTEGLDDPYPGGGYRGWADRLAERLAAVNPELRYANLAIRGRKLPRIRAEQLEPAVALEPDLTSVLGGVNDILRRRVDLDRIAADLESMVATLRAAGATVLVVTYPDLTQTISLAAGRVRTRVAGFNGRVRAIGVRQGAVVVDLERDDIRHPSLWSTDRLHASSLGHERIAAVAAAAGRLLGRRPRRQATRAQPVRGRDPLGGCRARGGGGVESPSVARRVLTTSPPPS